MKLLYLLLVVVLATAADYVPRAMTYPQPRFIGSFETWKGGQIWPVWFLTAKPGTAVLVARLRVIVDGRGQEAHCESRRLPASAAPYTGFCFVVFPEGARLEGLDIAEYEDSQFQKAEVVP